MTVRIIPPNISFFMTLRQRLGISAFNGLCVLRFRLNCIEGHGGMGGGGGQTRHRGPKLHSRSSAGLPSTTRAFFETSTGLKESVSLERYR